MTIGKLSGQCDFGQKGQSYCNQRGQSCVAKRVKVAWLFHAPWLVQGAAIYINLAAPCTTEIHTENQHFTLRVKPLVQPRFLHRLLLLCLSCNPVIPKNKKSPETFPFFGQNPYICISSKSKAKQCSETRTATKSLPATELSTL